MDENLVFGRSGRKADRGVGIRYPGVRADLQKVFKPECERRTALVRQLWITVSDMSEGQINFESLQKLWESATDVSDNPPSSGMMTKRTLRYIVSRFPQNKLHACVQDILDDPAFSDDVVFEFFGESMFVRE